MERATTQYNAHIKDANEGLELTEKDINLLTERYERLIRERTECVVQISVAQDHHNGAEEAVKRLQYGRLGAHIASTRIALSNKEATAAATRNDILRMEHRIATMHADKIKQNLINAIDDMGIVKQAKRSSANQKKDEQHENAIDGMHDNADDRQGSFIDHSEELAGRSQSANMDNELEAELKTLRLVKEAALIKSFPSVPRLSSITASKLRSRHVASTTRGTDEDDTESSTRGHHVVDMDGREDDDNGGDYGGGSSMMVNKPIEIAGQFT